MSDNPKIQSNEERIRKLQLLYDDTLDWVIDCVSARKASGTGAAAHIMRTAREEIAAWLNDGVARSDSTLTFEIPGLDFSGYAKDKTTNA